LFADWAIGFLPNQKFRQACTFTSNPNLQKNRLQASFLFRFQSIQLFRESRFLPGRGFFVHSTGGGGFIKFFDGQTILLARRCRLTAGNSRFKLFDLCPYTAFTRAIYFSFLFVLSDSLFG